MKCQSCGADGALHELIEIVDGHVETMRFCANCLPDRVRETAPPTPVLVTGVQQKGGDLHIWITVANDVAQSKAMLKLSADVEMNFPVDDGDIFKFTGKAHDFRPECEGDLIVHISVSANDNQL